VIKLRKYFWYVGLFQLSDYLQVSVHVLRKLFFGGRAVTEKKKSPFGTKDL
jgi:hypothetical protein